jgi:hypothetical protein
MRIVQIALLGIVLLLCNAAKAENITDRHRIGPASCHPHCGNNEGDLITWTDDYPADLHPKGFTVQCIDVGDGNPCVFDHLVSIQNDASKHQVTIQWFNRSDTVDIYVAPYDTSTSRRAK